VAFLLCICPNFGILEERPKPDRWTIIINNIHFSMEENKQNTLPEHEEPREKGSGEQAQPEQGQREEHKPEQSEQKKEHNTAMAVVAYILFFVPLLTDAKNDPFVKYHVKQGLVLFIAYVIVMTISWMPFFYWFAWIFYVALLVLFIIGIMHAVNGEEKPLPFIGHFADKFNI